MLQRALDILWSYGVPVFPLNAKKEPVCAGGHTAATKNPDKIRELFATDAAVLVGVPTGAVSGFDVLDIDAYEPAGAEWLKENAFKIPTAARIQKTGSGGWHVFFRHHEGLRCSTDNPSKDVDIRGDGGYVCWWHDEPGCELIRDGALDGCEWPAELIEPILAKYSYRGTSQPKHPEELAPPSPVVMIELLERMPNPADCDRNTYVAVMMAVQGAIRGLAALGSTEPDELEKCADAACLWSSRWDHPNVSSYAAEREKWESDFSHRENDLSGWRQLLGYAHRLGVDTREHLDEGEFEPLMPEIGPNIEVWDPWEDFKLPKFPMEVLPSWLHDIVLDTADMIGTDVAATAMAYVGGIAAAIHGQTRVRVQRHSNWTEAARLWIALVGDPSARKSPLMGAVMAPMQRYQKRKGEAYMVAMANWEALDKAEKAQTPKPKMPIYVTDDATPEAIAEALSGTNRGLLMHADELSLWLGSMERYGKGSSRGFWLQSYNGQGFYQHRIGRGYVPVNNMSVSVLGGIQPDRLARLYKDDQLTEDGLLQRFLPVLMGPAKLQQDRPARANRALFEDQVEALLEIGRRELVLDEDGHVIKEQAFAGYQKLAEAGLLNKGFASWLGKGTGFLMRLAVALHFCDPASLEQTDAVIPAATIEKAVKLMEFMKKNSAQFYKKLTGGAARDEVQSVAGWLLTRTEMEFTLRHFGRGPGVCRGKNEQEIRKILSPLETQGWLIPDSNLPGNKLWRMQPGIREVMKHRTEEVLRGNAEVMDLIYEANNARKAA